MSNITIETETNRFAVKLSGVAVAYVFTSPTGDCQTYSIANADQILAKPNALDIFKAVQPKVGKKQLLMNVREDGAAYKQLKELFKGDIIIEQPYTSTRGSSMCMFLVNTRKLIATT